MQVRCVEEREPWEDMPEVTVPYASWQIAARRMVADACREEWRRLNVRKAVSAWSERNPTMFAVVATAVGIPAAVFIPHADFRRIFGFIHSPGARTWTILNMRSVQI